MSIQPYHILAARHAGNSSRNPDALTMRPKISVLTGDGDPVYELAVRAMTNGLNHEKLSALLTQIRDGALDTGLQLCEDMEELDSDLVSVCNTRQRALTALDWEVQSAADTAKGNVNKADADQAAQYVRDVLGELECFDGLLRHMSTAITRNFSADEIIWDGIKPVDFLAVAAPRLYMDPQQPGVVRVRTRGNTMGYVAKTPDFIVHIPHGSPNNPFRAAPLRIQAREWLIKQIAKADWSKYVNIFGTPFRWATYEANATDEEKARLLKLLETMGRLSYGAFSKGVELELKESSQRGDSPHQRIIEWVSKVQAKLLLGGNLTSDTTGGTGTFAAGKVQEEVREDLRDDDIAAEGATIRQQLIAPMVWFKFWRPMPLPKFRRVKPEAVDRIQLAQLIESAQRIGIEVGADWAHDTLGIPKLAQGELALKPRPSAPAFGPHSGFDGEERLDDKARDEKQEAGEEEVEGDDERD